MRRLLTTSTGLLSFKATCLRARTTSEFHCSTFGTRDGDDLAPDDEGLELPSLERVQQEAARFLADMARDAVRKNRDGLGHQMAIEVRDEHDPGSV